MPAPTEIDLFKDLNEKQIEAVKATEGMVRVVAGAGSGKTRVLAHRYAQLVNTMGINPANILCATFTNKAAQEMRSRISRLVSAGNVNDFVCTIHSLCVKILRKEIYRIGYPKNFTIIDEEDQKVMAKEVFKECPLTNTEITTKQFLDSVRLLKMGGIDVKKDYDYYIESIIVPGGKEAPEKITPEIAYIKKQHKSFLLDFDDLILFTLYILNHFETAKEYWQQQLNYIMLDEAQDCSGYDWAIIRLLGEKHKNIFIVGDPDQCIYEWRGVNINNFLNFPADTDIVLNENYRSIPNVLEVANSIISHNKRRIKKELFTRKENTAQTIHFHGKTEFDEYDWIANQICKLKENGYKGSDVAILYRASYLSRGIEQALMRKNIKYEVWGGVRFFERKEIKDALCYLRLISSQDNLSFKRVVNTPGRSFGPVSIEKLEFLATKENTTLFETLKNHQNDSFVIKHDEMAKFICLIEECRSFVGHKSILDILDYVLKQSGYIDLLRKDEDQDRIDNINELLLSIKYYQETHEENALDIEAYLQDIALYTNMDFKNEESSVKLMTIHQAKGLEFPYVFVCGLSEGIFPNNRTIRESKEAGLEEERRLMYVAVTRAERGLFLSESEGYNHNVGGEKYPSRFLREIKKNLFVIEGEFDETLFNGTDNIIQSNDSLNQHNEPIKYKVGDQVKHHSLGVGTIIEILKKGDYYLVNFNGKIRNISANYRFENSPINDKEVTNINVPYSHYEEEVDNKQVRVENQKLLKTIDELRKELDIKTSQIESLLQTMGEKDDLIDSYESEINWLRSNKTMLENQLIKYKQNIDDLTKKQSELENIINEKEIQIKQQQDKLLKSQTRKSNSVVKRLFGK